MEEVLEEKKSNIKDILSTINKDVQFSQTTTKFDILIEYNPNYSSLSLKFTQTYPSSIIYKQSFTKQNIKTITNKCQLRCKDLYELLSVQLSSKKSIAKFFRIYKDSKIDNLTTKYTQFMKMSSIPDVDMNLIDIQPPPANIPINNVNNNNKKQEKNSTTTTTSDEDESLEFDVDGLLQEFDTIKPRQTDNNNNNNRISMDSDNSRNTVTSISISISELPLGWAKLKDDEGYYYFNVLTSEKQRTRPMSVTQSVQYNKNINSMSSPKKKEPIKQEYLLFIYHFAPSKYINCNYCFILKQETDEIMGDNNNSINSIAILPPFRLSNASRVELSFFLWSQYLYIVYVKNKINIEK